MTFFNIVPELILAGAFLESFWKLHRTGAQVPEQDPKGVDVDRVVILSCQEESGDKTLLLNWKKQQLGNPTLITVRSDHTARLSEVRESFIAPVNSSGAMWMGVPTILPDIIASGLQKPKSVIFARFCLSN